MSIGEALALKELGVGDQSSGPHHVVSGQMPEGFVASIRTTSKVLDILVGRVRLPVTRKHPTGKAVGNHVTV